MTAAYRLKGLGWFAGCVVVTLGFYLVSLQVAAERTKLLTMEEKIASAQREIRALETEFDTRSNMIQLEKWNGDALALVVPTAAQFVKDEAALASLDARGGVPQPLPGDAPVRTANYVVPSISQVAPAMVAATAPAASPAPRLIPASVPVAVVTVAPNATPTTKAVVTRIAVPARPAVAAAAARKAQAVALLDKTLLSDSTLGDLMSGARAERRTKQ